MTQLMPEQQAWLDALRSGEYKQTKFVIRDTNIAGKARYCCLGVFAEINNLWNEDLGNKAILTPDIKRQYNIPEDACVQMNDAGNKTFTEIADYLEDY